MAIGAEEGHVQRFVVVPVVPLEPAAPAAPDTASGSRDQAQRLAQRRGVRADLVRMRRGRKASRLISRCRLRRASSARWRSRFRFFMVRTHVVSQGATTDPTGEAAALASVVLQGESQHAQHEPTAVCSKTDTEDVNDRSRIEFGLISNIDTWPMIGRSLVRQCDTATRPSGSTEAGEIRGPSRVGTRWTGRMSRRDFSSCVKSFAGQQGGAEDAGVVAQGRRARS